MLSSGSYFAGYRIERQLGRGGMGTVYLARNPDLPRSEALKILSAELSQDAEFRARFIQEADVAASLDHPNIVSVHQRGQFDGQLWIAMQFVDGVNADDARRAGQMTPARAVYVLGEVAKAVDYAHQRGVIHRDIKPANFLLAHSRGGDERVLLGDFGIARALGQTGLTETGAVMATLTYAAPEVLDGQRVDGRADLYSLGCALFRLLTGQAPFGTGAGAAAVIAGHLHQPPPTVSDRVPGIPPAMDAVIATAMAKDPDRRFTSARELAHAAASALHGPSAPGWVPGTPPASGPGDTPRWYQGPPQTATLAAPPVQNSRRPRFVLIAATAITAVAAIAAGVYATTRSHPPATPAAGTTTTTAASIAPAPTTTPAPAAIVPSALGNLLVPADQFADIMGAPDLRVTSTVHTFENDDSIVGDADQICVGAFDPAQQSVYGHTGALGVVSQLLQGDRNLVFGGQVVVALPSAEVAQHILADQVARWSACAGRTITKTQDGQPPKQDHWTFGPVQYDNGILSISYRSVEVPDSLCRRAMSARKNVAIDTLSCRSTAGDPAVEALKAILAKVPQ